MPKDCINSNVRHTLSFKKEGGDSTCMEGSYQRI